MGHVVRETRIAAPRERVFDLARHVEAHVATMPDERAEGATGLLELGDRHHVMEKGQVVWHGDSAELNADHALLRRHLGVA